MKKIIMFVLLLTIISCDYSYLYFPFGEYEYNQSFETIDEIFDWIIKNIYGLDQYKAPDVEATYTEMKGDCVQQSWLMIDMIYHYTGQKASLITYRVSANEGHAVVLINNTVYDPARKQTKFNFNEFYSLHFLRCIEIYNFEYLQMHWTEFR